MVDIVAQTVGVCVWHCNCPSTLEVDELRDPVGAVGRPEKVRLRPATQFTDVLYRRDGGVQKIPPYYLGRTEKTSGEVGSEGGPES